MAKDNYSYKKQQKELAKEKKAEKKKQKKLEKKTMGATREFEQGLSNQIVLEQESVNRKVS